MCHYSVNKQATFILVELRGGGRGGGGLAERLECLTRWINTIPVIFHLHRSWNDTRHVCVRSCVYPHAHCISQIHIHVHFVWHITTQCSLKDDYRAMTTRMNEHVICRKVEILAKSIND